MIYNDEKKMRNSYGPLLEHLWSIHRQELIAALRRPLPRLEIAQILLPHLASLHPAYDWLTQRLYERASAESP